MVNGQESNLSMLVSSLWHELALFLHTAAVHYTQKFGNKEDVFEALADVAKGLNSNRYKKEENFLQDVVNSGVAEGFVIKIVMKLRNDGRCSLTSKSLATISEEARPLKTSRQMANEEHKKHKEGKN